MPYVNTIERVEREKAVQEGRQETLQAAEERVLESKRNTARHLLAFGVLSDEQTAEATGLTVDEIAKLRMKDKH
ncbi:hypothetical protein ACTXKF_19675 [Vreelandella alkaliphila]|uniref:hypothetical protein n=1 Tax=Vreelandella alkaliphila TaxID=272774 RepID=UPI003FD87A2C